MTVTYRKVKLRLQHTFGYNLTVVTVKTVTISSTVKTSCIAGLSADNVTYPEMYTISGFILKCTQYYCSAGNETNACKSKLLV